MLASILFYCDEQLSIPFHKFEEEIVRVEERSRKREQDKIHRKFLVIMNRVKIFICAVLHNV
jgi:hypothetical protein